MYLCNLRTLYCRCLHFMNGSRSFQVYVYEQQKSICLRVCVFVNEEHKMNEYSLWTVTIDGSLAAEK